MTLEQEEINKDYLLELDSKSKVCCSMPYTIYTGDNHIIKKLIKKKRNTDLGQKTEEVEEPIERD
jgi:hypothetical protein